LPSEAQGNTLAGPKSDETLDGASKNGGSGKKTETDYKEVLPQDDFALCVRLREWKKQTAAAEAVPVYTII
jgi:hypothetical protein